VADTCGSWLFFQNSADIGATRCI